MLNHFDISRIILQKNHKLSDHVNLNDILATENETSIKYELLIKNCWKIQKKLPSRTRNVAGGAIILGLQISPTWPISTQQKTEKSLQCSQPNTVNPLSIQKQITLKKSQSVGANAINFSFKIAHTKPINLNSRIA